MKIATGLSILLVVSAPAGAREPRALVVGDSWAWLAAPELQEVLDYFGHADKEVINSGIPGATAADLATPESLADVTAALEADPTLDAVHLSIGGNDFLLSWNAAMSSAEEEALFDRIATDVDTIVTHALGVREDVEVVIAGYDYLNFVETVAADPLGGCAITWLLLGLPTPLRLNDALTALEQRKRTLAEADPRVHYVDVIGFMQVTYGYPGLGIPPLSPLLPDADLPSPPEAMGADGQDCIHLSETGYEVITTHAYNTTYDALLTPPGAPRLLAPDPGLAGTVNRLTAVDLPPGATIRFVRGTSPGLTEVGSCPGLSLDMSGPRPIGDAVADADGRVELDVAVPAELSGTTVWLQAADPDGCGSTNAVVWVFR